MSSSSPSSVSTSRWVPSAACVNAMRPHVQEVVALALEPRVGRDAHGDVEVAGDAAARRGRAAAGEAQALAVVDARRGPRRRSNATRARDRRRGTRWHGVGMRLPVALHATHGAAVTI